LDVAAALRARHPLLAGLWAAPIPATLQGRDYKLVDVNDAYASMLGLPREALIGRDPIDLQPPEDRESNHVARAEIVELFAAGQPPPPMRRRLVDGQGRERWFALALCNLAAPGEPMLWLSMLQDLSAEYTALREAQRAQGELAQWFDLSVAGMLVYDEAGLIVRNNAAFEALVERVPQVLDDVAPEWQELLGWRDGAIDPALRATTAPGGPAVERQAVLPRPGGGRQRLRARLSAFVAESGSGSERRVMVVLDDLSAEEERDLARLEMGMLMDTASIGVATYDPARGWLAPSVGAPASTSPAGEPGPAAGGALLGIGRELVEPGSRADYERLQRALRQGERAEVRYAVRHPELGARWLLTRVEPGALAGGRRTTSVVTLDVTEQARAQQRNEQLLRELTTILDGSTAGIAYLRGPHLVRCNQRFERMLGLDAGAAAGATLTELFGSQPDVQALLQQVAEAPAEERSFETELPMGERGGGEVWYSLSVRASRGSAPNDSEAVAVLTDISRLKSQQAELEALLRDRELMFSLSDVGIAYVRGARFERANQALAAMTGYAAPELTALDTAELYVSARECVEFEAQITQAIREQGRFSGERLLRQRSGAEIWVQVAARPVHQQDTEGGLICSFVDIDERRRAREALAGQAERTRAILNSVLVGIVTVDARGAIDWMNRSARRMFGGELADFVGEPMATVATPEPDHPLRRSAQWAALEEGVAETFECRLRGRDGREFWVVGNAVATGEAASGGPRQLTFALLDIERRRQAEVTIAQAQASLQRVIETAPLAIALFDAPSRRILQVNQTAGAFFGRPVAELLGRTAADCTTPAKAAALAGWLAQASERGEPGQHELRDTEGAQLRVWDCRVAPLAASGAAAGTAEQWLLVASDVTEQRAAEEARLKAAIDQREVLVREVHHRIKNNLQGVAGLLQQNAARHPELAETLSEAVGQVQAIAQVYGLQVGSSGPLAAAGLMRAIAASVQRTFGRTIVVDEGGGAGAKGVPHLLPETEAIPIALTINELLTNAIKHGAAGAVVRCTIEAEADAPERLSLRVRSTGALPAGFSLAHVPAGVSGLGLVRALLPRRSATLALEQHGDEVVAHVELRPPSVRLPAT
jgi:PAS domain S-box-containing protein